MATSRAEVDSSRTSSDGVLDERADDAHGLTSGEREALDRIVDVDLLAEQLCEKPGCFRPDAPTCELFCVEPIHTFSRMDWPGIVRTS